MGVLFLIITIGIHANNWFKETLYSQWGQRFKMDEVLFEQKTDYQHIVIFKNKVFGTVMALDGVVQTTQKDEFIYHEMMAHVPLLGHGNAKNVLIIGGGDGGTLREVLRHNTVEKVTLVEIDAAVIQMAKKYFPTHSNGAFDDPRTNVVIQDGCAFVKETSEKYDVIICDSTDPIGPGQVLFAQKFYNDCHNLLREGGIFVCQSGVPFMQSEEFANSKNKLQQSFKHVGFYCGVIPSYVGGFMVFGIASDTPYKLTPELSAERLKNVAGSLRYYSPRMHSAAFALPGFIRDIIK